MESFFSVNYNAVTIIHIFLAVFQLIIYYSEVINFKESQQLSKEKAKKKTATEGRTKAPRTDRWTDGCAVGRRDRRIDVWKDGWTDG